jgi:hypothetical protein
MPDPPRLPTYDEIRAAIENWYDKAYDEACGDVDEWLGWSWEEYSAWCRDPMQIPDRPLAHPPLMSHPEAYGLPTNLRQALKELTEWREASEVIGCVTPQGLRDAIVAKDRHHDEHHKRERKVRIVYVSSLSHLEQILESTSLSKEGRDQVRETFMLFFERTPSAIFAPLVILGDAEEETQ